MGRAKLGEHFIHDFYGRFRCIRTFPAGAAGKGSAPLFGVHVPHTTQPQLAQPSLRRLAGPRTGPHQHPSPSRLRGTTWTLREAGKRSHFMCSRLLCLRPTRPAARGSAVPHLSLSAPAALARAVGARPGETLDGLERASPTPGEVCRTRSAGPGGQTQPPPPNGTARWLEKQESGLHSDGAAALLRGARARARDAGSGAPLAAADRARL